MPRWPALVRRARRPSPLLADVALALVLTALSLVTIETERTQSAADVRHAETDLRITPSPGRLRPGDPVEIRLSKDGKPVSFSKVEPLLTIQNTSSGRWTTYEAKPTREPGVYRVPAVFPGKGFYSYTVLYGPFEQNLKIGKPTRARPAVAVEQLASGSDSFPTWPVGLTLLATLPIALRRRFPLSVLAVTLPAALAMDVLYNSFQFAGALVALYTVAAYVGRPGSIGVGVGAALALSITQLGDRHLGLANSVAAYVFFGGAWLLGDRLGARRAYLRELEERALRLQQERQENERRAAAAEQARIGRELHDIIMHNVSVMTVQAAAAGDVFETQPNRAREALDSIESTGREALTELRRLLGTVRPDDGASTFDPQPRLARLDALLEQVRGTGLGVELTVEGEPRHLPAGVDLSAYRIVQEALTNTLKHAQASHVSVLVRYGTGAVELDVVDDGAGPATAGGERGYGIVGMRERAALFGGKLEAGPVPGGGFSVRAQIPLGEDTT
jgi:signal transduction histidine kinase